MVRLDFAGAAEGAMQGGQLGSAAGPYGSLFGAAAGAGAKLFKKKKKKKEPKKVGYLDEQQQGLYNDRVAGLRGEGPMSDLYNFDAEGYNDVFDQTVGRPAYRQFEENVIPRITGQFRGQNLMNSSYAGESLSRAGRDVQEGLDAQRSANIFSGQQQSKQDRMKGINDTLNMQTFGYDRPEENTPSSIDRILSSAGQNAGAWFTDMISNYRNRTNATAR
jgi:hypothetical protein